MRWSIKLKFLGRDKAMRSNMACPLLGGSIQSAFSFISHINSLHRPLLPFTSFSRVIPNQFYSWPKSRLSEARFIYTSGYLPSSATFQGNATAGQEKFQENGIEEEEDEEFVFEEEIESCNEDEGNGSENNNVVFSVVQKEVLGNAAWKPLELTVKEKKELGAYAHSLGKKLKCQQVGKSGVTSSIVTSISEALEANELLKLKVHNTCPDEMDFVASQLQATTHSVVVGQIGRTLILYRPSRRKLSAVEKKKPPQRLKRSHIVKSTGQNNRRI